MGLLARLSNVPLLLCVILCFTGISVRAAPSRPVIKSFTADISLLGPGQQDDSVKVYVNIGEKKFLMVSSYGRDPNSDIKMNNLLVPNGNKTTQFLTMSPFLYCTASDVPNDQLGFDYWAWVKNATYTGQKQFTVHHVDTWSYEDKTQGLFYQIGVSTSNANVPVYYYANALRGGGGYGGDVYVIRNFKSGAPSESVFTPPKNCTITPQEPDSAALYGLNSVFKGKF